MPTESALPPRFHHHQPPLLLALALMEITSFPEPVWILVLLIPVVLLRVRFHHQPPLPLEEALILILVPELLVAMKEVLARPVAVLFVPDEWLWILT